MSEYIIILNDISHYQYAQLFNEAKIIDSDECKLVMDEQLIVAVAFDTKEDMIAFKLKYF